MTPGKQADGTIAYYAFAGLPDRRIGQLLVTKRPGEKSGQRWTGIVYKTTREAMADTERLNCVAPLPEKGKRP
jgi:hypothetical protein